MEMHKVDNLKILLYGINYAPEPVGIGKYSGELAKWLSDKGHKVRVITAQPYYPRWKIEKEYINRYCIKKNINLMVWRCPLWIPQKPNGLKRLLHLATFALTSLPILLLQKSWRPDVIITVAPAFFCAPNALLIKKICGQQTKTWLHIQDFELDAAFELGLLKGRFIRKLAERWEKRILRGFDRVSTISRSMLTKLKEKGVNNEHCIIFTNWVDLNEVIPHNGLKRIKNPYRLKFEIGDDKIVMMYSGSMNKKQDLNLLAEVILKLDNIPNLIWLLAGEGPIKHELVAATSHLRQVIHLPLQPADQINNWLNAADIHLLPQKAETADLVLPSKLLGILASGRPVIASSPMDSEIAELVNQAGICVEPGNSNAFVEALRRYIDKPNLRTKAGKQARTLAEKNFEINNILGGFERELADLVKDTN